MRKIALGRALTKHIIDDKLSPNDIKFADFLGWKQQLEYNINVERTQHVCEAK